MKRISTLTANPYQKVTFITESGKDAVFVFRYLPTQQRWIFDLEYDGSFIANGIAVCCHPNLLDKWHNILDFGINVTTDTGLDPFEVTAFDDGSCFVSILNKEEKNQATEYLNGI